MLSARVSAHIGEWQNPDRRTRAGPARSSTVFLFRTQPVVDSKDPHGEAHILQLLLAHVSELASDAASDLIANFSRHVDLTWTGECLQPRCNVDTFTED